MSALPTVFAIMFCQALIWLMAMTVISGTQKMSAAMDQNGAARLRTDATLKAYLQRMSVDPSRADAAFPPLSDHQRHRDPLLCEMLRDLQHPPQAEFFCP